MNRAVEFDRRFWGDPPWEVEFSLESRPIPAEMNVAIVGGGFTGLAAAAWLRRCAPEKTVAVFEASRIGSGASGRTGGIASADTAAGKLPGLGDVLGGFRTALRELQIDCDAVWNGTWEVGHFPGLPDSPIRWQDSGTLQVISELPGGTVDPGKLVSGLVRAAQSAGALLYENASVREIHFGKPHRLELAGGEIVAEQIILATNAYALELGGLDQIAEPKLTLAVATEPLTDEALDSLGLAQKKAYYTIDLPYLWGRMLRNNGAIFGSGLIHASHWADMLHIDIRTGEAAQLFQNLERRVRGLHPVLRDVKFSHHWAGPILFSGNGRPFFHAHPQSSNVIVLGGYTGQGVTLSVYLSCWAAEVLLGRKRLPEWGVDAGTASEPT